MYISLCKLFYLYIIIIQQYSFYKKQKFIFTGSIIYINGSFICQQQ